jgi:predicted lipoprotein with Yx(FWY)xxD motif
VKRTIYALCLGGVIATMIAGCGGSDSTASGGSSKEATLPGTPGVPVITAKTVGDLGKVLVDPEGRTLYFFDKDQHSLYSAKSSGCYGPCAENWPPLLTEGEPEAEDGAYPTKLSTLKRKDGTLQVTYYGHPLYTYVGDKKPGEANGNDVKAFGGQWHAGDPNG